MKKKKPPVTYMKLERMKKGLTQQEIAEKLEISQGYAFQIESLISSPSLKRQKQLEQIFNLPVKHLLSVVK